MPTVSTSVTPAQQGRTQGAFILHTEDERDLQQIVQPHVQAVIFAPKPSPDWLDELTASVTSRSFEVPRTVLPDVTRPEIDEWLQLNIRHQGVSPALRLALKQHILSLVDRLAEINGATHFMLRILTDIPNHHCGFHVDTVPPGAPVYGLLLVYNGAGTDYVHPDNVTSMRRFYRYLSRRERLAREMVRAHEEGNEAASEQLLAEITELDEHPDFLLRPQEVFTVPAGSIVAFKHIDVTLHWSDHAKTKAWIHRSPMEGEARLLVNITARAQEAPRLPL
jgi:Protein of unknown function (DUF1826)